MTTIYRVYLNRGIRAKTEVGLFSDKQVADFAASQVKIGEGESVSVDPVEVNDAGTVDQYVQDLQLARLRSLLTPEEIALLAKRGGLV